MKVNEVVTPRLRHSVLEAGSGEPLLLLHGFTGAKEDFADFVDGFADRGWHVVAPDLRGHGDSDKPTDEAHYTLDAMAEDAFALAEVLGWERFHLLGHSMGGMVAQVMAIGGHDRLGSLVLMNTGHGQVPGIDAAVLEVVIEVVRTDGIATLMELAAALDTRAPAPADARVRAERPGYVAFGERKMLASSPAMYAAMAAQLPTAADRLDALAGLRVPTLVVVGDQDTTFLGQSRALAEAIPGARFELIPDAAHCPQFENPDRWWKAVSRFLDAQVAPAEPSTPAPATLEAAALDRPPPA